MWRCRECGYANEADVYECENCGHRRKKKSRAKLALMMFLLCVALISLAVLLAVSGQYENLIPKERAYEIESGYFGNGDSLKWTFYSDNSIVISGNGRMENFEKRGQSHWKTYLEQIRKVVIEDGVENIGANVFNGCGANEVVLGESVESIEKLAFANCVNLKEIDFPKSVKKIGDGAFMGCLYLKNAYMTESVETISDNAFDMCHEEFKITAPEGSEGAGFSANKLGQVPTLEEVEFDVALNVVESGSCGSEAIWTLYEDGRLEIEGEGDIDSCEDVSDVPWYKYRDLIKSINIKDGIEIIGKNAFRGCDKATFAEVNCTGIGDMAFYGCAALEKVKINSGAVSISEEVFVKCTELKEIHIPATVKEIKYSAFKENSRELKIYGDTRSYARFYALIKFIGFREG